MAKFDMAKIEMAKIEIAKRALIAIATVLVIGGAIVECSPLRGFN